MRLGARMMTASSALFGARTRRACSSHDSATARETRTRQLRNNIRMVRNPVLPSVAETMAIARSRPAQHTSPVQSAVQSAVQSGRTYGHIRRITTPTTTTTRYIPRASRPAGIVTVRGVCATTPFCAADIGCLGTTTSPDLMTHTTTQAR
jgi:hypothetical protein